MDRLKKNWRHFGVMLAVLASGMTIYWVWCRNHAPLPTDAGHQLLDRASPSSEPLRETSRFFPSISIKEKTLSLSEDEKKAFLKEVAVVFDSVPNSLNKDALHRRISRLNERGQAATAMIVEALEHEPTSDKDIASRLSMIDYLVYRAKFDPHAKAHLVRLASAPIAENTPNRYLAPALADRAEMTAGLAGLDWETASQVIQRTGDAVLKQLMSSESYYTLLGHGANREYALALVQQASPDFSPK